MIELATSSPDATRSVAAVVAKVLVRGDLIVLAGDLGAGKTCFTQGVGAGLGVQDRITSPTFTLANRYESGRLELNHLDVYRLDDISETLDLDLPELLESGVTVIEWGEEIEAVLPADHLTIRLSFDEIGGSDDERRLRLEWLGEQWHQRAEKLRALLADWMVVS